MNIRILLSAVIGGVVITLLTGMIPNTPHMIVGGMHYGHPFAWLIRLVLAPQYFPWRVNAITFIIDIIIWSVIIGMIIGITLKIKKEKH
jgi:hypothetical protein